MVNIRNKGSRGEREAVLVIGGWLAPVYRAAGMIPVDLERNLMQSRQGGYDLVGIDWLALEVKRHETLSVSQWWKQTLRQAGPEQVPFLMYRQNRTPWRYRTRINAAHHGPSSSGLSSITVDMAEDAAREWLCHELWFRLKTC